VLPRAAERKSIIGRTPGAQGDPGRGSPKGLKAGFPARANWDSIEPAPETGGLPKRWAPGKAPVGGNKPGRLGKPGKPDKPGNIKAGLGEDVAPGAPKGF